MTITEAHPERTVLGQRLLRKEDPALLTGESRFTNDLAVPGALHLAVLRSPYASATINSVDVSRAQSAPGVVAVYTGADLADQWAGPMPCAWPVTADMKNPTHYPLAVSRAAFAGDGVACVLATSDAAARDALELIDVDYAAHEAVIAAHQLEASADDIEFSGGVFRVAGLPEKEVPLAAIAFAAFTAHDLPDGLEPNLEASTTYDPPNFSWPFGTHMCALEVDTETGQVDVLQYVAVDDCGVQVNPLIVDGQVHGGVVQGLAQALYEEAVYDTDGNLKNSTLAEYLVPAACDVPPITTGHTITPSPTNQLGVKGIGEAGTIGAAPAVINAIVDALSGLGVHDVPMPASPLNVWNAINNARRQDGSAAQGGSQ